MATQVLTLELFCEKQHRFLALSGPQLGLKDGAWLLKEGRAFRGNYCVLEDLKTIRPLKRKIADFK